MDAEYPGRKSFNISRALELIQPLGPGRTKRGFSDDHRSSVSRLVRRRVHPQKLASVGASMTLNAQDHPLARVHLFDGLLDGFPHDGLSFLQLPVSLHRDDNPVGRILEAEPVQVLDGSPINVTVRLNDPGYQGSSLQV